MAIILLSEKYSVELHGVLNCYDRIIITGNVHCDICHSACGTSGSGDSEPDDWFFNILCGWNFCTSL